MPNLYSTIIDIKDYNHKGDYFLTEYDMERGIRFSLINRDKGLLCDAKMHDKEKIKEFLERNY